ncbi:MAG: rRNA maturation RNase YbeY [Holosporaceae bacterium]|jgi:probable rRNA maturation factor|nr:rRNA maturation RNase YbeY [Holosporaceae bacterium]
MNLEIIVEGNEWDEKAVESIAKTCIQAIFSEVGLDGRNVEVCLLFTNDSEIRTLNRTYRKVDAPTNVLSFPADDPTKITAGTKESTPCILGSIALASGIIRREAQEQSKIFYDHTRHLLVHGMLHLLRYNHEDADQAKRMEELEVKILRKLGVADPYAEEEKGS